MSQKNFSVALFEIPEDVNLINIEDLPNDWIENESENSECRIIGRKWYAENESLIMAVPSAVIKWEYNYTLNTGHPDFEKIKIKKIEL